MGRCYLPRRAGVFLTLRGAVDFVFLIGGGNLGPRGSPLANDSQQGLIFSAVARASATSTPGSTLADSMLLIAVGVRSAARPRARRDRAGGSAQDARAVSDMHAIRRRHGNGDYNHMRIAQ